MRIPISETGEYFWYGRVWAKRFCDLGAEVCFVPTQEHWNRKPSSLRRRLQQRLKWGPAVARINRALLESAIDFCPDVFFAIRGDLIWPDTVRSLAQRGAWTVLYNNDNPFSPHQSWYVWRHAI